MPVSTHWVLDSFARDPWAGTSMLAAAQLARMSAGYLLGGQAEHTRPGTSC